MTTPTLELYPSAPLEKKDLEQKRDKKLNDANSFNNSKNTFEEKIFISKVKFINQTRIEKLSKTLTSKLESVT